jgi:hypothetical protein
MIFIIAIAVTGSIFLWLLLRVIVRKWLERDTERIKERTKRILQELRRTRGSKKAEQTTLLPFMYDHYPYERYWNLEGWEDIEESEAQGFESSAEMDLEDEQDLNN